MQLRFAAAAYRFRESLFALPALIVLAEVCAAEASARIDTSLSGREPAWTIHINSNAATWLLSTVAGAMITTAGVVFSLAVVSLQLASSQFSPRMMRSFIRDRLLHIVIASLVATFVFCVLTLRHISGTGNDPAPSVSRTVALASTVVTVMLIVAYFDRLARGLQVGEVVRSIAGETRDAIEADARRARARTMSNTPDTAAGPEIAVLATRDGWISQIPTERIFAAVPDGASIELETRPGAYIHGGEVLFRLWRPDETRRPTTTIVRRLQASVVTSHTRTMQQDVDFAFRQLTDIALRALSSAINDPTTASEVVLRLGSLLRRMFTNDVPATAIVGPKGKTLLRPWLLSREEYLDPRLRPDPASRRPPTARGYHLGAGASHADRVRARNRAPRLSSGTRNTPSSPRRRDGNGPFRAPARTAPIPGDRTLRQGPRRTPPR